VVAAVLAWPKTHDGPRETAALATPATTPAVTPTTTAVRVEPAKPDPMKPDPEPAKEVAKSETLPPPKPVEVPKAADTPAPVPTPMPPAAEPVKAAGPPPAPSIDRVVIGQWEKREPLPVLVRLTPADPATWVRVPADAPELVSTDRLTCLPGYKATVKLGADVTVDLWGNLPDLFQGAPLLEASLTPTLPAPGVSADLTLYAGRFYVGTKNPKGAAVRLRIATEVWDVTLADDKTEVVLEVSREPLPGPAGGPTGGARVSAGMHVNSGRAAVTSASRNVELGKADEFYWDSLSRVSRPRLNADERTKADRSAYWSKFPVYPDAALAKLSLAALDAFSKKIADPNRVRATFDEALQDRPETTTLQSVATARVAVLMFASLGDVNGLADCLGDPNRPYIRQPAILGLRSLFAADPPAAERFRDVLVGKAQLPENQADAAVQLLRGFTPAQRSDPETLTALGAQLLSPAVQVRELALYALVGFIDPADPASRPLLNFDAAGSAESRAAPVAAWAKKIEQLKRKMAEPPK